MAACTYGAGNICQQQRVVTPAVYMSPAVCVSLACVSPVVCVLCVLYVCHKCGGCGARLTAELIQLNQYHGHYEFCQQDQAI